MFLGVLSCLAASVIFATLCFYTVYLAPLDSFGVFGWRILGSVILIAAIVSFFRDWRTVLRQFYQIIIKPSHFLLLIICTAFLAFQMFAFAWAPLNQESEALAMGYFLLPLMMVLCGRFIFHDTLSRLQVIAVVFATVGVLLKLLIHGHLSWISLAVMLGYPPYFILKKRFSLNALHSMLIEHVILVPVALILLAHQEWSPAFFHHHPDYAWPVLVGLGILGGSGLLCFVAGSKLLPLSLFGLLGYVEPLLLFLISLILPGSTFSPVDFFIYIPIWLAILCLIMNGWQHYRNVERVIPVS